MAVELRAPPAPPPAPPAGAPKSLVILQGVTLLAVLALGAALGLLLSGRSPQEDGAARARAVASKLKAAGADGEAAALYAEYLSRGAGEANTRAAIAYSLGQLYLEGGQYERALRWFYEAEALGPGDLESQVSEKIVHALERLGRVHAAKAALGARTGLSPSDTQHPDSDPVVAKIGGDEIRRSEVERSLDDLPPQLQRLFSGDAQRAEYLRKYVADELLWRKAKKLEYDDDPEVRRQLASLLKQVVVSKFVEKEVVGKITVDEADLRTYHQANRELFDQRESASVSVIKLPDAATAKEALGRIRGGESFEAVARALSLHAPSKGQGGKLEGWVQRGDDFLGLADPPAAILLSDGLFATAKGAVSEPIVAGGYAYLLKVHDKKPGQERPFEEVRGAVEQAYRTMKAQSSYQSVVEEQLQSSEVELYPERL